MSEHPQETPEISLVLNENKHARLLLMRQLGPAYLGFAQLPDAAARVGAAVAKLPSPKKEVLIWANGLDGQPPRNVGVIINDLVAQGYLTVAGNRVLNPDGSPQARTPQTYVKKILTDAEGPFGRSLYRRPGFDRGFYYPTEYEIRYGRDLYADVLRRAPSLAKIPREQAITILLELAKAQFDPKTYFIFERFYGLGGQPPPRNDDIIAEAQAAGFAIKPKHELRSTMDSAIVTLAKILNSQPA